MKSCDQAMRRRLCRSIGCVLFLALAAAAAGRAHAQDYDDEGSVAGQKRAWLSIDFHSHGEAHAELTLPEKPASWDAIRAALGQALHCSPSQFANSQPKYSSLARRTMTAQQWERYRSYAAKSAQRQLRGSCAGVLEGDEWTERGSIDLSPLAQALHSQGITEFSVGITCPQTAFTQVNQLGQEGQGKKGYAHYRFDTSPKALSPIRIAFGFRPRDLRNAGLIVLGFILVPILIILWIRRETLKRAGDDIMGAWFSYHRTVNWCLNGAFLIWAFSDFGARETLNQYFGFRWGSAGYLQPLTFAALIFIPYLAMYAASMALSHQVFVQLRNTQWKRGEYLLVQLLQGGRMILPLMFVLAGIGLLFQHPRLGIVCFLLAYILYVACLTWSLRIAQTHPQAVTTGELRDKVFELAKRAAVSVRQVFVLPAGRSQMANAFASKNNIVMFTDYLLERLTKREVNAVAAHELTHLQKHHPTKLGLGLWAAIFAPIWIPWLALTAGSLVFSILGLSGIERASVAGVGWYRAWAAFERWPFRDLLMIVIGFSGFYFLSRRFECEADAGAVALAGDPEASITSLLKLSRLNLMPIQWGKVSGAWLTHPATLRRVERIAERGGVTPDRLRQILQEYNSPAGLAAADDRYAVPAAPEDRRLCQGGQLARSRINRWVLIIFHWLPAALTALLVEWRNWQGSIQSLAYVLGLAATLGLYFVMLRYLGASGRARIQQRLLAKVHKEGIPVDGASPLAVGLSPAAMPRFYVTSYNWDTGLLFLTRDRLYFLGSQLRCALRRDQVLEVRLGPGAPSWISMPRVYLRWKDEESNRAGVLNLVSAEPCSAWGLGKKAQELFERVSNWKQRNLSAAPMPQLDALTSPALGEVTSHSPKALITPGKSLKLWMLLVLPVAVAACVMLRVQAIWYVVLATVLVRFFELIPHWRYRERPVFTDVPALTLAASPLSATKSQ